MSSVATLTPAAPTVAVTPALRRADWLLMLAATVVGAALRAFGLGSRSYWIDEAFTLQIAAAPGPGAVLVFTLWYDNHPPLYHLLLHLWLSLGLHEGTTRALSALLGVAAIPLIFWLGRMLALPVAGVAAAWLLALSPFHIAYSQELRMYSLVVVLMLAAVGCYWRWLTNGGRWPWLGFVVFSTLALAAEYLAGLVMIALALHFVFVGRTQQSVRAWLVSQVAIVVLAIPLMATFLYQAVKFTGQFWVPNVPPSVLPATLQLFSVGYSLPSALVFPAAVLFAVPIVLALVQARARWSAVLLLLLWALLPMLMLYVISVIREPVYIERALISSLPGFLLLVALGIASLQRRGLAVGLTSLLLLLQAASLATYYAEPRFGKPDAQAAAAYLTRVARPGDLVVHGPATYETFQVYHQLIDAYPADEALFASRGYAQLWDETLQRMADEGAGAKGSLVRQTPYGAWREHAHSFRMETLKTRVLDDQMLQARAPTIDRVHVVAVTDAGTEQLGQPLYLTRGVWRHPLEAPFDAGTMLPGFTLSATEHFSGLDVHTYTRS